MPQPEEGYSNHARWLADLILGRLDPASADVPWRLAILRAQYRARLDGGMLDLIARAWEAHYEAVAWVAVAADRAFLIGLIDGSGDLLSEDTFPRMEPLFEKYEEGSPMFVLLEQAAGVFSDAVGERVAWTLAGLAIEQAQHGPDDEGSEESEY